VRGEAELQESEAALSIHPGHLFDECEDDGMIFLPLALGAAGTLAHLLQTGLHPVEGRFVSPPLTGASSIPFRQLGSDSLRDDGRNGTHVDL